jgi:aminoglycoside 3-N-acetyltransferase
MSNHELIRSMLHRAGAEKGSMVCIQSALRSIGPGTIPAEEIIAALQSVTGSEGTIIMPAYNFHAWTEQKIFSYRGTVSEVGRLTEIFRTTEGVVRTPHPVHSLSVWGHSAQELSSIDSVNSFAEDSIFAALLRRDILYVTLGTGLAMPFLPCHHTEHVVGAGYREMKLFSGTYIDEAGSESVREYGFDVKKDEFRQIIAPVYSAHIELHKRGVVKMENVNGTEICWSRAKAYDEGFAQYMDDHKSLFKNA